MRIEEVEFRKTPGELYRCGAMPVGRALLFMESGAPMYARANGEIEPFDYIGHFDKYVKDVAATDWERVGVVDFADLAGSLASLLAPPTAPASRRRSKGR